MAIAFFNSLGRKMEQFEPLESGRAGMYTCGPTVYDYAHIGNFRAYVWEDVLRRYLEYKGYAVRHVMNLTDVDDKTIKGARAAGVDLGDYTEKYANAFFEDVKALNIEPAHVYPRATDHVGEMIGIISLLLEKGIAYKAPDGVYFSIAKFPDYGKLAGIDVGELKEGARVRADAYEKEGVADFALWKNWDEADGNVVWPAPFGEGRPGWHVECSAMASKYLGQPFDIHTGGVDNKFPHHENEAAQSEAAFGKPLARYWMHCEHLLVDGKKMSKSLGNFFTLRQVLEKGFKPAAVRWLLASGYYRQQLNFTFKAVEAAERAVGAFTGVHERAVEAATEGGKGNVKNASKDVVSAVDSAVAGFERGMDADLNTPLAVSAAFGLVRFANKQLDSGKASEGDAAALAAAFERFDKVFGVLGHGGAGARKVDAGFEKKVEALVAKREALKKAKDYSAADAIRVELKAMGVAVEDSKSGPRWKPVG